ncbi:MAG: DUF3375 family protein, partial [Candidatus Rokuibacteriota bacterium]
MSAWQLGRRPSGSRTAPCGRRLRRPRGRLHGAAAPAPSVAWKSSGSRTRSGDLALLDDTALRDRFQQVSALARELLSDFREVEHNFRQLDRNVREEIATWEGRKGELLERI